MDLREDEDTDSDSTNGFKRRNSYKLPRFVKHSLDDVDLGVIILNSYRSQYQVLEEAARQMGWVQEKETISQTWDILWTDTEIGPDEFFKMHQYQKVSHFPGINILARKNSLGKGLMKMRKQFPKEYNFFPLTWSLPSQFNELAVFAGNQQNKHAIFIVKPEASCQGKGIFLTKSIKELQSCNYVVQQYLQNPLLITKLKFDFRIYVLLLGCDPLRVYIYNEGLARFATEPYKHPKQKNLKSACVHLTNYSLNKKSPNFIFNESEQKMDVGHKRSLSSIMIYLQKIGVDVSNLKDKINDLVIKTLISAQPLLSHIYKLSQPNNHSNDMCFQILGLDIILDDKIQPYLLEVNHNPSLVTDTPLDKFIKKKLVKDTLNLLNINLKNKVQKVNKKLKQRSDKQNGIKTTKLSPQQRIRLRKQCQKLRDQYEESNLGGFSKIYPTRDEFLMKKYDGLLRKSRDLFEEVSGIKYDIRSQCISLEKNRRRASQNTSKDGRAPSKKKYYSVKTTNKKPVHPESSKVNKTILKVSENNPMISARSEIQKSKLPHIQKGKFLIPQMFYLKDWQPPTQYRVPIYLSEYLIKPYEKRLPSRRQEIRRRK